MFVQLLRWRREIPQAFPDEEMPKVDEAGSLLGKKTDEQTLDQRMLQHLPFAVEIICYFILITVIINYQSTENDSTLMLTDAFPTHMIFAYINYCFIIPTLLLLSVIFYSINRLISVAILSYLVFSCPGLPGSCGFLGHVFTVCNPNISPPQILLYITGLIGFTWIFSHIFVSSLHRRFIGSSSGVLIEKRMKIICLGTIAFLLCVLLTLGTVQWIPS
jgi:chromate transport protein ChrA